MNARPDMYPRIVERGDQAALLIDQPAWVTMVRRAGSGSRAYSAPRPGHRSLTTMQGPAVPGVPSRLPRAKTE